MNDTALFHILTAARLAGGERKLLVLRAAWKSMAAALGADRARELLNRWPDRDRSRLERDLLGVNGGSPPVLRIEQGRVSLGDVPLGRIAAAFRAVSPTEIQVRLAYDALVTRFLRFLAEHPYRVAVLHEGAHGVQVFIPGPRTWSVEELWAEFVGDEERGAFSRDWLKSSFVDVMNVVKLSSRGIGTPQVTIAHRGQRDMLVGWMLASIRHLAWSMIENHTEQIRELGRDPVANAAKIADREERRAKNAAKYGPIFARGDAIVGTLGDTGAGARTWLGRSLAGGGNSIYTQNGMSQFATDPLKLAGVLDKAEKLMELRDDEFVAIDPLLREGLPAFKTRGGGDDQTSVCYACGRPISRGDGIDATRLVLGNPLRRRQSSAAEGAPKICPPCAAIATLSPFKDSDGIVIVEWRPGDGAHEAAAEMESLARMLVLAQLRIQVGPLVLLGDEEYVGNDPLRTKLRLNSTAWAKLKLAEITPETIIRRDDVAPYLHLGRDAIRLDIRHVEALHHLLRLLGAGELGQLAREPLAGALPAIGQGIRALLDDRPYQAIYRIIRRYDPSGHPAYPERLDTFLERVIGRHRKMASGKAKLWSDVAALTGLVVPFINSVEYGLRGSDDQKRTVRKLIEAAAQGPNVFGYLKARESEYLSARMFDRPENHFVIEETLRLLGEIGVDPKVRRHEQDSGDTRMAGWEICLDDLAKGFKRVFTDYATERDEKELTTELKYSLAARFPKYFSDSNDKED